MFQVLSSDILKIKRKMILFLILLGPFGVIALQACNFFLRYDFLTNLYKKDLWGGLIENVMLLSVPTLFIGLTIITSMIANIEHQTNAWKQLLALPVSKIKVFTGKFLLSLILLCISSTFLWIGTILLGIALDFGKDIPYAYLSKMMYFPFLAIIPFIALQVWLAITVKNQAIALTCGILGTVLGLYAIVFPDWVPYKWPYLMNHLGGPSFSVLAGISLGILVYLYGLIDFTRKDVL